MDLKEKEARLKKFINKLGLTKSELKTISFKSGDEEKTKIENPLPLPETKPFKPVPFFFVLFIQKVYIHTLQKITQLHRNT